MKGNRFLMPALAVGVLVAVVHLLRYKFEVMVPDNVLMFGRWLFQALLFGYAWQRRDMTTWILASMFFGLEIGIDFPVFAKGLDVFSKIFLKLIKTIIAPLLFGTLVVGIAGHSDMKQVGRMGLKALLYFEIVTTLALVIGLLAINFSRAGDGIKAPERSSIVQVQPDSLVYKLDTKGSETSLKIYQNDQQVTYAAPPKKETWKDLVLHIFPENISKMIFEAQVLQIVVFSILFALALFMVGEDHKKRMLHFAESISEVMFKFTAIIMYIAPFAVGGAIAATVANMGLDILRNLGLMLATLYVALIVFVLLVFVPIMLFLRIDIRKFWRYVKDPAALAFATASSETALPLAMQRMEEFGVPRKVVSFVIPTGFTFNLDGSTLYLSLASIFIAQAAGIELSIGQQILICVTLMLTSKGVAGVARASLVILAGTCAQFGLPEWPIAIILGIDALMDLARTMVNLVGNCLASVVIAKWEGEME